MVGIFDNLLFTQHMTTFFFSSLVSYDKQNAIVHRKPHSFPHPSKMRWITFANFKLKWHSDDKHVRMVRQRHTTTITRVCITCAASSKPEWRIHSATEHTRKKTHDAQQLELNQEEHGLWTNFEYERILNMNDRDVTHWPIRVRKQRQAI